MNLPTLNTQTSYDAVAPEYAQRFRDEMDDKPFDRDCLDRLAREVGDLGPICDLGCGPGQIARYLHRQGVETHRHQAKHLREQK
jgi:trans-aconitate methyltransferase